MQNSRQFYINGAWVDPLEANDFAVENPATGEVVDTISLGSSADVDRAVAAARAAFDSYSQTSRDERLALLALLFAFGTIICVLLYLQIPFEFKTITKEGLSWATVGWLALIYLILSVPFLLGGATIALAISRLGQSAGQVYAYDLIGASAGCLVSIVALMFHELFFSDNMPHLMEQFYLHSRFFKKNKELF